MIPTETRAGASTLAFIVPVRDDADRLARCLRSIRAAVPGADQVRLIVVDNGSVDDSAGVAVRHGAEVLSLPGLRLGALRNAAAAASAEDVVVFVDADHEIDRRWASAARELFRDPAIGAAGAPYQVPEPATWVQSAYGRLRRHPEAIEDVEWLGSGNLAVRRALFESIGGFDTSLETCEDVDLCRRLRARGVRLVSDPRLRSVHHGDPRTLRHVFLGELWRGRDNLRVSWRRPRSLSMLASALLPTANMLAIGLVVLGLTPAWQTLWVAGAGALTVISIIGLRSVVMLRRQPTGGWRTGPQVLAVAAAYELGRACAILGRFGYGRRRAATQGPN